MVYEYLFQAMKKRILVLLNKFSYLETYKLLQLRNHVINDFMEFSDLSPLTD